MFDTGTRTEPATQGWCFPDRSFNVALAACVFQQWFLIVLHDTDICRQLSWDHQRARPNPCNHMKWDFLFHQNHMRRRCFSDFSQIQLKANSVVAVETHRWNLLRILNLAPFNIPSLQSHPRKTKSGVFLFFVLFSESSQLTCCCPSVTW